MTETRISAIKVRPVVAPMARPLATAGGAVSEAPLVLIDLETSGDGAIGHAYVFAYHPWALGALVTITEQPAEKLIGEVLDPPALQTSLLAACRLLGWQGLTGMAILVPA